MEVTLRRVVLLLAFLCLGVPSALPQSVLRPSTSETHRLSAGQSITIPVKCDTSGNLYLRSRSEGPATFDVVQLSPDGTRKAAYKSADSPGLKDAFVHDFSIGDDGKVYEIVQALGERVFVLKFSPNGEFDSRIEIVAETSFMPAQLVALHDGTFFIAGTENGDEAQGGTGKSVDAIYDASGKLLRKIFLKESVRRNKPTKLTDRATDLNAAIRFGRVVPGQDGNIYVMRASSPATVYVISPTGKIVRVVKVDSPFEKATPIMLMLDAGRLAIEFSDPTADDTSDTTIRVADALTGEKIADYRIAPELTEAVACYSDNRFTFIGNSNGWPAIMQVNAY